MYLPHRLIPRLIQNGAVYAGYQSGSYGEGGLSCIYNLGLIRKTVVSPVIPVSCAFQAGASWSREGCAGRWGPGLSLFLFSQWHAIRVMSKRKYLSAVCSFSPGFCCCWGTWSQLVFGPKLEICFHVNKSYTDTKVLPLPKRKPMG